MSTGARRAAEPSPSVRLPGRYTIRGHIATGGMASVWCAEDRLLGRQVAIKLLSDRFADDELAIRRFKREARAAARVSAHPHVVTIFDVGEIEHDRGRCQPGAFIVMEYLVGGTVADALRCRSVGRGEARRWLREAASALDHAHERGVVHRDVKPANFLLDRGRGLHVADFGIARLQSEDTITSSGELIGTAAYLAPEQALGHEATSATDIYSLAVAAFELMTGGRPFTAAHFAAQARQHIEDHPPAASARDPTLPPAVDQVLWRGMAKRPADRYRTAGLFVEALEAALDDGQRTASTRPLVAPTPATATRSRRRPATPADTRRPKRSAAIAALAVVALGVLLLISQLPGGSSAPSAHGSTARHGRAQANRHAAKTAAAKNGAAAKRPATGSASASTTAAATPSAAALQLQGHDQVLAGDYQAAIATLHRALATASRSSLTYAYALYDLGRSLLESGNPRAAIPILEQRLKIPNQTAVVQRTLDQALRAAAVAPQAPAPVGTPGTPGTASPASPGGPGGSGGQHGKGHGHGGGNGNGQGNGDD